MSSEHIVSKSTYYTIYLCLLVLTYSTVQVAYFDLGPFNIVAALGIAFLKASLVVMIFMHGKWAPKLQKLVMMGALFWLAIMFSFTMMDYVTRFMDIAR